MFPLPCRFLLLIYFMALALVMAPLRQENERSQKAEPDAPLREGRTPGEQPAGYGAIGGVGRAAGPDVELNPGGGHPEGPGVVAPAPPELSPLSLQPLCAHAPDLGIAPVFTHACAPSNTKGPGGVYKIIQKGKTLLNNFYEAARNFGGAFEIDFEITTDRLELTRGSSAVGQVGVDPSVPGGEPCPGSETGSPGLATPVRYCCK